MHLLCKVCGIVSCIVLYLTALYWYVHAVRQLTWILGELLLQAMKMQQIGPMTFNTVVNTVKYFIYYMQQNMSKINIVRLMQSFLMWFMLVTSLVTTSHNGPAQCFFTFSLPCLPWHFWYQVDPLWQYPPLLAVVPLTLWEPGYNIFVLRFQPVTSSCQLPYQRPSSSTDCTRELLKGSNKSDNLLVCTRQIFFWLGVVVFCEWRHKWSSFWLLLPDLGPNC